MKKKIAILGSTSSIGKSLLSIIKNDKKKFEIKLLTANTNYKDLIKQAKKFNVKNIIITDPNSFNKAKIYCINKNLNVYQNFNDLKKILPKKLDYVMSAISGIGGLIPTFEIINRTKIIAIANKEAIICGWEFIKKELKRNKTKFIPVDSEHFSLWSLLQNSKTNDIEKIYITASGGPFLNLPKKSFSKITVRKALNHPNWKMGKKITIDSATLMNKVFEVIEAKNIFDIPYKKISILTHPNSYIHSIIKFKNGLTKILAHDPDMRIPIFNSLYLNKSQITRTKPVNLHFLNNLKLKNVNTRKFFLTKTIANLPQKSSLYETILITVNDYLVYKFLENRISFKDLMQMIQKFSNLKEFQKFKKIKAKNIEDIYRLRDYVSLKMNSLGI
tara:strand:- start:1698 stop:2861 length:1164 start_codon:yes stop_codon:yes gene_type:complete